jgi:hypothetical protein
MDGAESLNGGFPTYVVNTRCSMQVIQMDLSGAGRVV